MVAAYRARATRRPDAVCADEWAQGLAGAHGLELSVAFDRHFPHMELWIGLRTAYLDRQVRAAIARGWDQVVLLGAGFDTRAARLAAAGVTFFEVDHPATQAAKRARLAELDGYPVDAARYVTCDFEHDDPVARLVAGGLDAREPTLVLWEGVVSYLTEEAVRATATRLATGLDARSLLAFEFLGKNYAAGAKQRPADAAAKAYIGTELGEPIRYGTDDVLPMLADCGFRWVRVLDFNEVALELIGDYQRERQFRFQRLVLAAVGAPAAGWP